MIYIQILGMILAGLWWGNSLFSAGLYGLDLIDYILYLLGVIFWIIIPIIFLARLMVIILEGWQTWQKS